GCPRDRPGISIEGPYERAGPVRRLAQHAAPHPPGRPGQHDGPQTGRRRLRHESRRRHDLPRLSLPRERPIALRKWPQLDKSEDPWEAPDPALALALQQLDWYARRRRQSRWMYRISELLILLTTATTTVAAALKATAWVTATLAASTVV